MEGLAHTTFLLAKLSPLYRAPSPNTFRVPLTEVEGREVRTMLSLRMASLGSELVKQRCCERLVQDRDRIRSRSVQIEIRESRRPSGARGGSNASVQGSQALSDSVAT